MSNNVIFLPIMVDKENIQRPNRIREHRKAKARTLEWLANECECSIATISDMERGTRPLRVDWMKLIARALEINAADLLSFKDNPSSLSVDEQRLLDAMRRADPVQRANVLAMAEAVLGFKVQQQLQPLSKDAA